MYTIQRYSPYFLNIDEVNAVYMKSTQSLVCLMVRFFCRRPLQYCSEIEKDLKPLFEFITAILNNHCKSCPCHEKMSSPAFCRCVYTVNVIAYTFCPALLHMFLLNSQYLEKIKYFRKWYLTLFQIMDVPKRVTSCDCGMTLVLFYFAFIVGSKISM